MSNRFAHAMPFGAELQDDGAVRFALWAPGQQAVALALEGDAALPMERREDGFFHLITDAAGPGSRYRYRLSDGVLVPDPASRYQPEDVHGASVVIDPKSYAWRQAQWRGRPWHETVLYELHVGAFSEEGTFDGLRRKLDHLVELGVSAIELMPLADFPGTRNWGYDGVLLFAPDASYGTPDDLKALIDAIHERGLMAFLDVVYNHFGPDGNYLSLYAPDYFDPHQHTPWGAAVNYALRTVRDVVIQNVLYWLQEYRFDGLRFDAVDRIIDTSEVHILVEIAEAVRRTVDPDRHVHLVLENDHNAARLLERDPDGRARHYDAQWNDDIHHVYHHLLTGEAGGYYVDYAKAAPERLARALSTGFVYQGERSQHRDGDLRGEPSGHLPPVAFVGFIQNHDQVGNRAFGERIADLAGHEAVRAMMAVLLLAPQIPLLFMGEEWGAVQPFCFFTDFHDALADAVREGRRREFKRFPEFAGEAARAAIPDPNAESTFAASRLDWRILEQPEHADELAYVQRLLRLRREAIVPRLAGIEGHAGEAEALDGTALRVRWRLGDGSRLVLIANLGDQAAEGHAAAGGELLFEAQAGQRDELEGRLPPWAVIWLLGPGA
ncbi:MAG: malto-oligosyltrehalose trehalohydrolase [Geminicoccaceae bacterium]